MGLEKFSASSYRRNNMTSWGISFCYSVKMVPVMPNQQQEWKDRAWSEQIKSLWFPVAMIAFLAANILIEMWFSFFFFFLYIALIHWAYFDQRRTKITCKTPTPSAKPKAAEDKDNNENVTQVSLRSIFHTLMPEILTLLPLIFPRRIPPGRVTCCRKIWLQQSKGPGLCSGQDQSWGFWLCNGFRLLFGKGGQFASLFVFKEGRPLDFPQLSPWMLLASNCLAQQSSFSPRFPLQELNHSEFHVQVVFLLGAHSAQRRKIG